MDSLRQQAAAEACAWFARIGAEDVSEDERRAFAAWLDGSALNREEFAALGQLWANIADLDQDVLQRLAGDPLPGGWQRFRKSVGQLVTELTWARAITTGAAVLIMGLAALVAASLFDSRTYETAIGEQRQIALDDGSFVTLNTNSRVRVAYTLTERRISLERGEAYFAVAHGWFRPFVVDADGASVRAVGTQFNVRLGPAGTSVVIVQGSVQLSVAPPGGRSQDTLKLLLNAGEDATIGPDQDIRSQHSADLGAAVAWRQGKFIFRQTKLGVAVAEMQRYVTTSIEISDPALAELEITGTYSTAKVPELLQTLELVVPVRVVFANSDRIVISPK